MFYSARVAEHLRKLVVNWHVMSIAALLLLFYCLLKLPVTQTTQVSLSWPMISRLVLALGFCLAAVYVI